MTRFEYAAIWMEMKFFSLSMYLKRRKEKKFDKASIKKHGFLVYCPGCSGTLNGEGKPEPVLAAEDTGSGPMFLRYTCLECSTENVFAFGLAPVPILMKDNDIKEVSP